MHFLNYFHPFPENGLSVTFSHDIDVVSNRKAFDAIRIELLDWCTFSVSNVRGFGATHIELLD